MAIVTVRTITLVLYVALVVTGCSSAGSDEGSASTAPTHPPESSHCVVIADRVHALADEIRRLPTAETDVDAVRMATAELSAAVEGAKASAGPELRASLDEAGQSVDRLRDSLNARPVDWAGLRAAASDLVAALGDAADICTPAATS
jgi:hypothetical protein